MIISRACLVSANALPRRKFSQLGKWTETSSFNMADQFTTSATRELNTLQMGVHDIWLLGENAPLVVNQCRLRLSKDNAL